MHRAFSGDHYRGLGFNQDNVPLTTVSRVWCLTCYVRVHKRNHCCCCRLLAAGLCYFGVSILGFYAFGTSVSDNVLLAFEHGPNHGIVAAANMMVVVHVAAAYQVYTQPVFNLMEARIKQARAGQDAPIFLQFGLRLLYVILITIVGILIPFFGALMGLVGAVAITPTTFLLPPLLWVLYKQPRKWGFDWTVNWALVWVTGLLGVLGTVGSVYGIIDSWSSFAIFAN